MAYETNTVLGVSALLAALETFLVANGWSVVRSESISGGVDFTNNNLVVSNTGFGGNDIIYAGFELITDPSDGGSATYGNLLLQSFTAFDASLSNTQQEGALKNPNYVFLVSEVSASIDYHFICNDRRIIVITSHDSGNIWEIAYIGYIIPYGNKEEFASPVFVGGSGITTSTDITSVTNYHNAFFDPTSIFISSNYWYNAFLKVGSNWTGFANKVYDVSASALSYSNLRTMMPYASNNTNTPIWQSLGENEDGYYNLFPITFVDKYDANTVYGELDGIYAVISSALSAGDIITYDGDNYIIVQNTYSTSANSLCAVRLT